LPDVADPEVAERIEGEPPGVAQAVAVDLLDISLRVAREGVVVGDGVVEAGVGVVDVDAEDRALDRGQVLAVLVRVVAAAAVPDRDVEVSVGAEDEAVHGVVLTERVEVEDLHLGRGVEGVGILGRAGEAGDDRPVRSPVTDGVGHKGVPVVRVVGVKGECDDTTLLRERHAVGEVEKD
jgi:hypothetical protein